MAFEALPGVKVISHTKGQTFIVGDFFAVYQKGADFPTIYRWTQIDAIVENSDNFIIVADGVIYKIPKSCVPDEKKLLNLRGILEGAVSNNPEINYTHQKRILPPKSEYQSGDITSAQFKASGVYNEREINFSNVVLLNTRLGKAFRVIAFLTILLVFLLLHVFHGETAKNWIYFIPVSLFTGGIVVMFVYLVCTIIARYYYASVYKVDPALTVEITFAVCPEGYSAVESHLHTGFEFIPWSEAAYFIETNYAYIIYKSKGSIFWLPKRLFEKDVQNELSDFIASRVNMK